MLKNSKNSKKTLAIDFDGVIHRYSKGWQDGSIYDPPMDGAASALKILSQRYNIVIFTVRNDLDAVRHWCKDYLHWVPVVTNKKPPAVAYIDDRAIRFTNWSDILSSEYLK